MMENVFMIIAGGEFVVGLLGNGFIGFTNCAAWIRTKKLCLVDLILTSLAWVRFSQIWLSIVHICSVKFSKKVCDVVQYNQAFISIWALNHHVCTWFAACLAVFYFLKIAHFPHPLFLWLKWRIDKFIFMLLKISVPFLFMSFYLSHKFSVFSYQVHSKYKTNMTVTNNVCGKDYLIYMILFILVFLPPFCLSLMSFLLLLLSLQRHKKHIELSVKNFKDFSSEAHLRAMKSVFSFLVLFVLHYFALLLLFVAYYMLYSKPLMMFAYDLCFLYPSAHSYVLIFGNSQMKKRLLGIFPPVALPEKKKLHQLHK